MSEWRRIPHYVDFPCPHCQREDGRASIALFHGEEVTDWKCKECAPELVHRLWDLQEDWVDV